MSEALSIFGRTDDGFQQIYNHSRKDPFDFLYLSVEHMEARRNHDDLLWDSDGFKFNNDIELDDGNKSNIDNENQNAVDVKSEKGV